MAELKKFDDQEDPDEDSYETPPALLERMAKYYSLNFELDAAATKENKVCEFYLDNALHQEWATPVFHLDVWCNHPHSLNEEFIRRADAQHKKHNINICMIIPTNCQSAAFWHEIIENETEVFVENHPVDGRPHFLKNGKKTKYRSRNAYRVIIWRRQISPIPAQAEPPTPYI